MLTVESSNGWNIKQAFDLYFSIQNLHKAAPKLFETDFMAKKKHCKKWNYTKELNQH